MILDLGRQQDNFGLCYFVGFSLPVTSIYSLLEGQKIKPGVPLMSTFTAF